MSECQLSFEAKIEKPWERRDEFIAQFPTGEVPAFIDDDSFCINDATAIIEYLQEQHPNHNLMGGDAKERARIRSLSGFFDRVFYADVVQTLVGEKALKRLQGMGTPDAIAIRQGYLALNEHMKHINWLAEQNNNLIRDRLCLADLSAAAQLSVVDYLGDVPWDQFPEAKAWYVRLKSRPSFRAILADTIAGLPPPPHYANLDF